MKQDNELWIKALKERLSDYTETPPPAEWKTIEATFNVPVKKTFPTARFIAAAAVALLLLATGGFYYLFVTNSVEPVRYAGNSVELHIPDDMTWKALPDVSVIDVSPYLRPFSALNKPQQMPERTLAAACDTVVDSQNEQQNHSDVVSHKEVQAAVEEKRERRVIRPSTKDKLHLPVSREKQKQPWSVMASVGNVAGLTKSSDNQLLLASDLPNPIPSANSVALFKQNELYNMSHKMPISFSVTVRKSITSRIAVESGVVYTFLSSEGKQGASSRKIEQKLHYVGIPLRGNYTVMNRHRFQVYLNAGGMVERCVYGEVGGEKQRVSELQFSLLGGIGAQYQLSKRFGLYLEPGVSYFFDDGSDVQTIRKENRFNFTMQAGVRLTY